MVAPLVSSVVSSWIIRSIWRQRQKCTTLPSPRLWFARAAASNAAWSPNLGDQIRRLGRSRGVGKVHILLHVFPLVLFVMRSF